MSEDPDRRPIKVRSAAWVKGIARVLVKTSLTPNQISQLGMAFAAVAGLAFWIAGVMVDEPRAIFLVIGALGVVLRLACNMFDGLVAVEGGKGEPDGAFWNEMPDRIADILILIGAGYGVAASGLIGPELGWAAAVLAVLTAYIREIGHRLGLGADFSGPMAKPHRMWVLVAAALLSIFETRWGPQGHVMGIALGLIVLGSIATVYLRSRRILTALKARPDDAEREDLE